MRTIVNRKDGLLIRPAIGLLIAAAALIATAVQANQRPASADANLGPAVTFLAKPPFIDGRLDEALLGLPVRRFASDEPGREAGPGLNVTYRLAYGTEFFYVFIEADQSAFAARDRGYQNGDGCHLVLALPRPDGAASEEFYVLGFTPTADPARRWQRQFIWYRNVDVVMQPLRRAQFREGSEGGKAGLEILIPWADVYPYHPWLSEAIGFNLCYVQAVGETGRKYHFVLPDGSIQMEQRPRLSVRLAFEPPTPAGETQAYAVLERNNIRAGEPVVIRAAVLSPKRENYVSIVEIEPRTAASNRGGLFAPRLAVTAATPATAAESTAVSTATGFVMMATPGAGSAGNSKKRLAFNLRPGLQVVTQTIDKGHWEAGLYTLKLEKGLPSLSLSILPPFDGDGMVKALEANVDRLKPSSLACLRFHLQETRRRLAALKPYDAPEDLPSQAAVLAGAIEDASGGVDAVARDVSPGRRRRAYRSAVDGTLQPYTLQLPAEYSPNKRCPLIVWLHGSGQDDRSLPIGLNVAAPEAIVLAPNGRGTSNNYVRDRAQDDIREALADVLGNFSVDEKKIFLGGFSMGGYGVYRTFFENPKPWRGLMVWAGHPRLWGADVDFLDEANLACFAGKEIFVYHGSEDRNCPIELTIELVGKLKKAGAVVEFRLEAGKGHEGPGAETLKAAAAWLKARISG
ncbi:MAG: prolyl oligopeptidase family serine peptidase [Candidatus Aminicenantes bacterium]|nr:prolyl oligopeptidase family serine peptidase [Candidatus Aminicenantes bacterium]